MEARRRRRNPEVKSNIFAFGGKKQKNKLRTAAKKQNGKTSGVNISFHPLFFVFGLYYAVTGKLLTFIIYAVSAVIHEFGHAAAANRRGYVLNSITLNAYGARISGNFSSLKKFDGLAIAAAGPLFSLFIAFFTAGSWWFFPETYPFTEIIYEANLSLGLANLIPIKPLDGGKITDILTEEFFGKKAKKIISVSFGIISFSALLFLFFYLAAKRNTVNVSLIFFGAFILTGSIEKDGASEYVLRRAGLKKEDLDRGVAVLRFAVSDKTTVKRLFALSDFSLKNEFDVYGDKGFIGTVSDEDVEAAAERRSIYITAGDVIKEVVKETRPTGSMKK